MSDHGFDSCFALMVKNGGTYELHELYKSVDLAHEEASDMCLVPTNYKVVEKLIHE